MAKIRNDYDNSWWPRFVRWLKNGSSALDDAMYGDLEEETVLPDAPAGDAEKREAQWDERRRLLLVIDRVYVDGGSLYRKPFFQKKIAGIAVADFDDVVLFAGSFYVFG